MLLVENGFTLISTAQALKLRILFDSLVGKLIRLKVKVEVMLLGMPKPLGSLTKGSKARVLGWWMNLH